MSYLQLLKDKIYENPKNIKLLQYLKIEYSNDSLTIPSDFISDGGATLFYEYGKNLPEETKYCLGFQCILVNEKTGEIFAFLYGRYTFILRCDLERNNLRESDIKRISQTLDDWVDITELGGNWVHLHNTGVDEGDEHYQFEWAYELSQNNYFC